ncbi:MAG: UbiA family prenyltransferase, partial [Planctomycetes bacterium]|nr:UbiA family prenyltransferase [Planctomycetota bacterium]
MAGWFLAGGNWSGELWWMMAGVSLMYVGGMTLNDVFDAEWDAKHAVERPIPAGAISARGAWVLGWGQLMGGILMITFLTNAMWYFTLALVFAIVLYDWTHKRWKNASVVMG